MPREEDRLRITKEPPSRRSLPSRSSSRVSARSARLSRSRAPDPSLASAIASIIPPGLGLGSPPSPLASSPLPRGTSKRARASRSSPHVPSAARRGLRRTHARGRPAAARPPDAADTPPSPEDAAAAPAPPASSPKQPPRARAARTSRTRTTPPGPSEVRTTRAFERPGPGGESRPRPRPRCSLRSRFRFRSRPSPLPLPLVSSRSSAPSSARSASG